MRSKYVLGYIDPGSGFTIFGLGGWLAALIASALSLFLYFFKGLFNFFRKKNSIILILLIIFSASALIIGGVSMHKKVRQLNKKIVILGFDGLDPKIIESMMADGKLANFKRLKEAGSYRRLSTSNPAQSPVAWAGFSTGTNPGKNGVFDFIKRDPRTYNLNLATSVMKNGKPVPVIQNRCFWHYTSEAGINTVIIGCPLTFPPYRINGRMLSGMGVPDILGTEGTFSFYTTEPPERTKDIAGNVFYAEKGPVMAFDIIGPKLAGLTGTAANVKIPLRVVVSEEKNAATIEFQGKKTELQKGRWSGWQEVVFKAGPSKRIRGVFKAYLAEVSPQLKLYMTPIDFDPRDPLFPISHPGSYSRELAGAIGIYRTRGMPADTWALNEGRLSEGAFVEQAEEILKEKEAMLNFELDRFGEGVFFCYFGSSDFIQHMFWGAHSPHDKPSPRGYGETIEGWYEKLDRILGEVMRRLGADDIVIVMSDHGFDSFRRAVHVNSWLRENGYLRLKDPRAGSGAELLRDIDWSATRAYAIGFGSLYINRRGRERNGIVNPGEEMASLKEEISQRLKCWRDETYDAPVIRNVYQKEQIFRGRFADEAPDLVIGFNAGYRASWQTALGAAPAGLIEDNKKKWSGDHLFDPPLVPGVIFSNKYINRESPSIYDIAPTILRAAAFDDKELKECGFDGEPLF